MVRLRSPSTPSKIEGLILNSYAKLNLYLLVINKRKDNYHNIKTVFERIDLSDKIILKSRRDKKIKIICNSPDVPKDNSNLTYRSASLLQESFNINRGVDIKIVKRIPVASGLGGGSSNAAAVLLGLKKLWRLHVAWDRIEDFAKNLGSDVPFFIYNIPFAQGEYRGEIIKPLKMLDKIRLWHILVVPKIKVSTAGIYERWDAYKQNQLKSEKGKLTIPKYNAKIVNLALKKKDFSLMGEVLFNSLEQITMELYPEVRLVKERLRQLGLKTILMSGSGPAVFAIVSSRKEAVSLGRRIQGENKSWRVFATKTA